MVGRKDINLADNNEKKAAAKNAYKIFGVNQL